MPLNLGMRSLVTFRAFYLYFLAIFSIDMFQESKVLTQRLKSYLTKAQEISNEISKKILKSTRNEAIFYINDKEKAILKIFDALKIEKCENDSNTISYQFDLKVSEFYSSKKLEIKKLESEINKEFLKAQNFKNVILAFDQLEHIKTRLESTLSEENKKIIAHLDHIYEIVSNNYHDPNILNSETPILIQCAIEELKVKLETQYDSNPFKNIMRLVELQDWIEVSNRIKNLESFIYDNFLGFQRKIEATIQKQPKILLEKIKSAASFRKLFEKFTLLLDENQANLYNIWAEFRLNAILKKNVGLSSLKQGEFLYKELEKAFYSLKLDYANLINKAFCASSKQSACNFYMVQKLYTDIKQNIDDIFKNTEISHLGELEAFIDQVSFSSARTKYYYLRESFYIIRNRYIEIVKLYDYKVEQLMAQLADYKSLKILINNMEEDCLFLRKFKEDYLCFQRQKVREANNKNIAQIIDELKKNSDQTLQKLPKYSHTELYIETRRILMSLDKLALELEDKKEIMAISNYLSHLNLRNLVFSDVNQKLAAYNSRLKEFCKKAEYAVEFANLRSKIVSRRSEIYKNIKSKLENFDFLRKEMDFRHQLRIANLNNIVRLNLFIEKATSILSYNYRAEFTKLTKNHENCKHFLDFLIRKLNEYDNCKSIIDSEYISYLKLKNQNSLYFINLRVLFQKVIEIRKQIAEYRNFVELDDEYLNFNSLHSISCKVAHKLIERTYIEEKDLKNCLISFIKYAETAYEISESVCFMENPEEFLINLKEVLKKTAQSIERFRKRLN
jgi:hypothetical protein